EPDTRIDFAARELLGSAMPFERDTRQALNVTRRADALRHGLHELEILGVEVAPRIRLRNENRADPLAVRLDRTGDQTLLAHRRLDLLLFVVTCEIDDCVASNLVEEKRTADLKDRTRQTFTGTIRMLGEVAAEVLHLRRLRGKADEVEQARSGVIEVDGDRAGNRVRDTRRRIVEVIEGGLHHVETEVGEAFRAAAAPRFTRGMLPLVGHIARQHDRADDACLIVTNRCRFQVDDAIIARALIVHEIVGLDVLAAQRAHRRHLARRQRAAIDITVSASADLRLGIDVKEMAGLALRGRIHPLQLSLPVVDRRRLRNLIEDRVDLGHLANGAIVQQRVVESERGVTADLAERSISSSVHSRTRSAWCMPNAHGSSSRGRRIWTICERTRKRFATSGSSSSSPSLTMIGRCDSIARRISGCDRASETGERSSSRSAGIDGDEIAKAIFAYSDCSFTG